MSLRAPSALLLALVSDTAVCRSLPRRVIGPLSAQVGRSAGALSDPVPHSGPDLTRRGKPGAADDNDVRQGEPLSRVVLAHTARWAEAGLRERSGQRLERGDTAGRHRGEELDRI